MLLYELIMWRVLVQTSNKENATVYAKNVTIWSNTLMDVEVCPNNMENVTALADKWKNVFLYK